MLAANGRLFMTMRDGPIYCFGPTAVTPKSHASSLDRAPVPDVNSDQP